MPRFFFHLEDGKDLMDNAGIELPDMRTAMREALRFAGAVLADETPFELWTNTNWSLKVTDNASPGAGRILLSLKVSAIDHTNPDRKFAR